MANKVLTQNLSEPLGEAAAAKIDIDVADGNLTIDGLTGGEPLLASGTLEYLEKRGQPTRSMTTSGGKTSLTLKACGGAQPWLRMPWAACNGATTWHIHLNPMVSFDITAFTGGGNVRLDLSEIAISRVDAVTGGGNMEVILPDNVAGVNVTVKSGAGNVSMRVPGGIAARIHATSGLGKVMVDPRFSKMDASTYQSSDYESAAGKVEITLSSGAGNVTVEEKVARPEAAAR